MVSGGSIGLPRCEAADLAVGASSMQQSKLCHRSVFGICAILRLRRMRRSSDRIRFGWSYANALRLTWDAHWSDMASGDSSAKLRWHIIATERTWQQPIVAVTVRTNAPNYDDSEGAARERVEQVEQRLGMFPLSVRSLAE